MRPKVLLFAKQQQLSLLSNLHRNCVQTLGNVCMENAARALYFRVLDVLIIAHVLHFTAILCANNLSNPDNGTVTLDANTFSSQANYSCSEGYVLNGTTTLTRVCQADGLWSGSEPTCEGWSPVMCTWCV